MSKYNIFKEMQKDWSYKDLFIYKLTTLPFIIKFNFVNLIIELKCRFKYKFNMQGYCEDCDLSKFYGTHPCCSKSIKDLK